MPLTIQAKASVNYSADEWELYTSMDGADSAARRLNDRCNNLIENNPEKTEEAALTVYNEMLKELISLSEVGADDSEPHYQLRNIIRRVYGENYV